MKKLFSALAFCLIFFGANSQSLYVADVKVTATDGSLITGPGIQGRVFASYIDGVLTLTLDNATITGYHTVNTNQYGIFCWDYKDFNIRLIGKNKIIAPQISNSSFTGILVSAGNVMDVSRYTIYGGGEDVEANSLEVVNPSRAYYRYGIQMAHGRGTEAAIRNCKLDIDAYYCLQAGTRGCVIERSHLILHNSASSGAIPGYTFIGDDVNDYLFQDCYFSTPEKGYFVTVLGTSSNPLRIAVPEGSADYDKLYNGYYYGPVEVVPIEAYPLYINGGRVTEFNKDDILNDGTMSFDPKSRTLTMNGVTLHGGAAGVPMIESKYGRASGTFTINLAGSKANSIRNGSSYGGDAFAADGNVTITGTSSVSFYSHKGSGINMRGDMNTLKIDQTTVRAEGSSGGRGIYSSGSFGTLSVNAATVTAISSGENTCGITGFRYYSPSSCKFSPESVTFSNGSFLSSTGSILAQVNIVPDVTVYPISINGVSINSANKDDVKFPGLNSGKVTLFVGDKYELWFQDADISLDTSNGSSSAIISISRSEDESLRKNIDIEFSGNNKFTIDGYGSGLNAAIKVAPQVGYVMLSKGVGGGNLTIDCINSTAIMMGANLGEDPLDHKINYMGIDKLPININLAGERGRGFVIGPATSTATPPILEIDRAAVTITGSNNYSTLISGFSDLYLKNAAITSPAGAYYDTNSLTLRNSDGSAVAVSKDNPLVISPAENYLWIANKEITSLNYNDIPGVLDYVLESGSVTFDPQTYTLTLDKATITVPSGTRSDGITYSGTRELTIHFNGYCNICAPLSELYYPIKAFGPIRITGSGYLLLNGESQYSSQKAIYIYGDNNVTFDNCSEVYLSGGIYQPNSALDSHVVFKNSNVLIVNDAQSEHGAVQGFKDVSLTGCVALPLGVNADTPDYMDYALTYSAEQFTFLTIYDMVCHQVNVVKTAIPGDVNGDGNVDITDVVAIANHVMGETPPAFNQVNADITGDNEIDVTDVVQLANRVLGN